MSRYSCQHPKRPELSLHYGFDRPLQEYFAIVFDEKSDYQPAANLSSCGWPGLSKNRLMSLLLNYGAPHHHIRQATLDLPFTDDDPDKTPTQQNP